MDGAVVLKVLQHAHAHAHHVVTGQLLGVEAGGVVEATYCFPMPEEAENEDAVQHYQLSVMRCLRDANLDCDLVGWYQSCSMGAFVSEEFVQQQYALQQQLPFAVCVLYDPASVAQGKLDLRAVRLSDRFMALYADESFAAHDLAEAGMLGSQVFEEVPIRVRNLRLAQAFLEEQFAQLPEHVALQPMTLASASYLERNLEQMIECIDDLSNEQMKMLNFYRAAHRQQQQQQTYFARRRAENQARVRQGQAPLPDEDLSNHPAFRTLQQPSRLDTLLVAAQVERYTSQVTAASGATAAKIDLLSQLHGNVSGN